MDLQCHLYHIEFCIYLNLFLDFLVFFIDLSYDLSYVCSTLFKLLTFSHMYILIPGILRSPWTPATIPLSFSSSSCLFFLQNHKIGLFSARKIAY